MPRCETTRDQYGTGSSFIDFGGNKGPMFFVAQGPLTKGAVLSAIGDTDVTGDREKISHLEEPTTLTGGRCSGASRP